MESKEDVERGPSTPTAVPSMEAYDTIDRPTALPSVELFDNESKEDVKRGAPTAAPSRENLVRQPLPARHRLESHLADFLTVLFRDY